MTNQLYQIDTYLWSTAPSDDDRCRNLNSKLWRLTLKLAYVRTIFSRGKIILIEKIALKFHTFVH